MPRVKSQPQRRQDTGTVIQVDKGLAAQARSDLYAETKAQIPAMVRQNMPQLMSMVGTAVPSPQKRKKKSPSVRVSKRLKIKSLDKHKKKRVASPKCNPGCVPATKGRQSEARMLAELERKAAMYDRMHTDVGSLADMVASPSKKKSPSKKSPSKKSRKSPCTVYKTDPSACNADGGCYYVNGAKQQYCRKKSPPKYPMGTLTPALPMAMAMYGPPAKGAPLATARPLPVAMARPM